MRVPRLHRPSYRMAAEPKHRLRLAAFKAAGFTHSALGVDSENPTGAYQLYERLGYRSIHRSVVRQMTV